MRLGKALGTMIVVAIFLIAISAVPSYASASVLFSATTATSPFVTWDMSGGGAWHGAPIHIGSTPIVLNNTADITIPVFVTGSNSFSSYYVEIDTANNGTGAVCSSGYLFNTHGTTDTGYVSGQWNYVDFNFSNGSYSNPPTPNASCTLNANTTYYIHVASQSNNNTTDIPYNGSGDAWVVITDGSSPYVPSNPFGTPDDFSDHFIVTYPANNKIVSSTTPVTVGAKLYINASDFQADQYLSITFSNQTVVALGGSALDAWNSAWGTGSTGGFAEIKIPLVSGSNDVSTTTSNFVRDGRVTATYAVKSPTFWSSLWFVGSLFSGSTMMSTTTQFVVGEKTDFDQASDFGGVGIANTILFGTTTQGFSTSTIEQMTASCIPLTSQFNLFGCAKGLIIPPQSVITNLFQQAKDGFLSYFPFGYVTRFYAIISGTGTTTLPSLSVTVPAGFPASGDTINLTMWGHLMGAGSYLSTATSTVTGHTFYGTFEPYWEKFAYFVFGLGVCLRLLGMNSVVSFGFGSKEDKSKQNIKYKKK